MTSERASVYREIIMELSQVVIACLVVGGGVFAILGGSTHISEISPFMGLVLGFYFRNFSATNTSIAENKKTDSQ